METNPKAKIVIVSGTNRQGSYTLKVAQIVQKLLRSNSVDDQLLDLAQLPPEAYLPTVYYNKPEMLHSWQSLIDRSSGVIFCIPEYNSAYPGILKHFIDVLRYPDSLRNKPVALVGLTSSIKEKSGALTSMTSLMKFLQADLYDQQVFISHCKRVISEDGIVRDANTYAALNTQLNGFVSACYSC